MSRHLLVSDCRIFCSFFHSFLYQDVANIILNDFVLAQLQAQNLQDSVVSIQQTEVFSWANMNLTKSTHSCPILMTLNRVEIFYYVLVEFSKYL